MAGIAKAFVQGNLTADPEMRETKTGNNVCSFGVAVNYHYYDKEADNTVEQVSYFDIAVFGRQAENCKKYLHKGDEVTVDGRLSQGRWEKDGEKRSKVEIVADQVVFGRKRNNDADKVESSDGDADK